MEGYAYGSIMANKLGELGGVVKLTLHETEGLGEGTQRKMNKERLPGRKSSC